MISSLIITDNGWLSGIMLTTRMRGKSVEETDCLQHLALENEQVIRKKCHLKFGIAPMITSDKA